MHSIALCKAFLMICFNLCSKTGQIALRVLAKMSCLEEFHNFRNSQFQCIKAFLMVCFDLCFELDRLILTKRTAVVVKAVLRTLIFNRASLELGRRFHYRLHSVYNDTKTHTCSTC